MFPTRNILFFMYIINMNENENNSHYLLDEYEAEEIQNQYLDDEFYYSLYQRGLIQEAEQYRLKYLQKVEEGSSGT